MSVHKVNRKSGVRWKAVVWVKGKQRTKTFQRKANAQKWERRQIELRENPDATEEEDPLTFKELVELYFENHLANKAESSRTRYTRALQYQIYPTFEDMIASEITVHDIGDWFKKLQRESKLKPKSLNMALGVIKAVCNWAVRRQLLSSNPAMPIQDVPLGQQKFDFWTVEEIEEFLKHSMDSHGHLAFMLALNTGMRKGEIAALKWDMVDLEKNTIRVTRTWCQTTKQVKDATKGKKPRTVLIGDSLRALIVERKLSCQDDDPWVVAGIEGIGPVNYGTLGHLFARLVKKSGLRKIRFHDLRHSFASHFVMNGGDLYALRDLLGHSSIKMTERYAHLSPDHLQRSRGVVEFGAQEEGEVVVLDLSVEYG